MEIWSSMMIKLLDLKVLGTIAIVFFMRLAIRLYHTLVAKPRKLHQMLKEQGIDGPHQTLLLGNLVEIIKAAKTSRVVKAASGVGPIHHNNLHAVFPYFEEWRKRYSDMFVFGLGTTQIVFTMQPEVLKDMVTCTSLDLGKPAYMHKVLGPLLGQGIVPSNGASWASQRKIISPEFYMERVKGMIGLVNESASTLVMSWKSIVEAGAGKAEIDIGDDMRRFSENVISRVCFGSNYTEGKEIFLRIRALHKVLMKEFFTNQIPGMRYLPTKSNRETWALEKELKTLILDLMKKRQAVPCGKDLFQMALEGAKNNNFSQEATNQFIVDNCKSIYIAGYETTALSASWTLMLLAAHPNWQDRVRAEVLDVCGSRLPDNDMLRRMKQLNMVIYESLRLYCPVPAVMRETLKDMKFRDLRLPEGVNLWYDMSTLHTDPDVWGPDSFEFNPERFANGITGACKLPHMYMPFGFGPRVCLGQELAMMELKILLSQIVSNFSFSLSPKYVHSPVFQMNFTPEFGVALLVKKL